MPLLDETISDEDSPTNVQSRALTNAQSRASALMSMVSRHNEHLLALMSTQERSWHHGDIFSTDTECPQMLINAHECS